MSKKAAEMQNMLANSAVNFGLLQPTVGQTPPAAPPAVEQEQKAAVKPTEKKAAEKPAAAKKAPGKEKKEQGGGEEADGNPFGYVTGPTWPLVAYEKPFLIPMPESQARAGAALSIRIPLDLNVTMEAHLARMGVKNLSEWVRHALERQLALEQQHLSKK